MNNREHYEFLIKAGITTFSIEDMITKLVSKLIYGLYKPKANELMFVVDKERLKEFNIKDEPINFGNLKVNEVYPYDNKWKVVIDEASPNSCPSFCKYIEEYMMQWGWSIIVETEW